MSLSLVAPDAPILRATAKPIASPKRAAALGEKLVSTMLAEGGVGLAAPQVGQAQRLFVTGVDRKFLTFINPEVTWRSSEQIWWEEGCLSLPRMLGQVRRPKQVRVKATDAKGKKFEITADDLLARVLQHELDHLDGVLFPDRMDDLTKLREITEEEWQSRFKAAQDGVPE